MKTLIKGFYAKIVLNRYFLITANIIVILIIGSSLIQLTRLLLTPENDIKEMLKICNGISIILYGYGVALETRRTFLAHIKIYPLYDSRLQQLMDSECHKYGIFTLLLGLSMEVLVHLITIPNEVLDTQGKESYIFAICLTILIFVSWLLMYFSYKLIRLEAQAATKAEEVTSLSREIEI